MLATPKKPIHDAEREAQHAYFSGRSEGLPPVPSSAKPFWARPIPPAAGVTGGLAAAALVTTSLAFWPSRHTAQPPPAALPPAPAQPTTLQVGGDMFLMSPTVMRLGDIPENAPFRASFGTIITLRHALYGNAFRSLKPAEQKDLNRIVLETMPPAEKAPIQLIKKDGKFYLCAFTFGRVPEEALKRAAEEEAARRIGMTPMIALYNTQASANHEGFRNAGRHAPPPAPRSRTAGGYQNTLTPPAPAQGSVSYSYSAGPAVAGADPTDGKLVQIMIPLDALGTSYSMHGVGAKAVIHTGITRLDGNAYAVWRPLPPFPTDPENARTVMTFGGNTVNSILPGQARGIGGTVGPVSSSAVGRW